MIGSDRLRQGEVEQQRICEAQTGRKKEWHCDAPAAEYAANGRPENKTHTKSGANQTHSFRAIFFSRDVGNVGLRGRNVSAGNAVQNASEEKQPESVGKTKN